MMILAFLAFLIPTVAVVGYVYFKIRLYVGSIVVHAVIQQYNWEYYYSKGDRKKKYDIRLKYKCNGAVFQNVKLWNRDAVKIMGEGVEGSLCTIRVRPENPATIVDVTLTTVIALIVFALGCILATVAIGLAAFGIL